MAKTDWKTGDTITAEGLNQTGQPIVVSTDDIQNGATTTAADGTLTVDKNGDLYQAQSGKQSLVVSLKGAAGTDGAKGDAGTAGKDGAAGVGVKSLALTTDSNGKVTGGTLTTTDNKTQNITVTQGQ
ncbi:hypothetical protein [Ligilactobacillus acidipiscis]|uniref:hypothetical protein n=1 Tax=Ligilactobacillus acidipiscis TaxID=89059 RepID=UPI0023F8B399|nr:hypothetical protein [Ligilactobacillus acidipiscis]WEV56135.1 hypothetical protein OZX66_07715 [Ligilactobacillus acidipiscis]